MNELKTKIELTDSELAILDGRCSPGIQEQVDLAKMRIVMGREKNIPQSVVALIVSLIDEIKTNGRLICRFTELRHCKVCNSDGGYAKYKSTTRLHKKGDLNFDKPLNLNGVEFADRFVRIIGYPTIGCCSNCFAEWKRQIADVVKDEKGEIPENITGYPAKWRKWDIKKCLKCGWIGNESEMGMLPVMIGSGYYYGKCPKCGAKNIWKKSEFPMAKEHVVSDGGWALVAVK